MTYITIKPNGKSQLDKKGTFCSLLENRLPETETKITNLLKEFDAKIKEKHSEVSDGALKNAHGDWYEWLLAIFAWNYHVENSDSYIVLLLPNVKQFDVVKLYNEKLYSLVTDLREKVANATTVQLVTSNPDFVILNTKHLKHLDLFSKKINIINKEAIDLISGSYTHFINQCSFEDIVGYLSVKSSLRPDRRLQISHEGSLMKAIYTHIQTRQWIISPKGLKYYAMATALTDADKNALKTVATHSITTVHSVPQAAVDDVFQVNSLQEALDVFQQVLH